MIRNESVVKRCSVCEQEFSSHAPNQYICSKACRREKDRHRKHTNIRAAERRITACLYCGAVFTAMTYKHKYCSRKCCNAAAAGREREDASENERRYTAEPIMNHASQDAAFKRAMTAAGYAMSLPVRDYTPAKLTPLGTFAPAHIRQRPSTDYK